MWDASLNDWIGSGKIESAYDAMGNQTLCINSVWDSSLNAFVNTEKWEKTFDTMGNETSCNKYLWNRGIQDWSLTFVSSSEYDTSVSGENVLGIDTRSKLLNESQTTMSDGIILSQKSSTYYYSPMSGTAISQIRTEAPEECIIDLYGKKVRQMEPGKIYIRGNAKVMMQ